MNVIKKGLVTLAEMQNCPPQGQAQSYEPYRLVVVKKDVVATGGQAFAQGHIAIAAPDRIEMKGDSHRLVFSPARASHIAIPDRDLDFLDRPNR